MASSIRLILLALLAAASGSYTPTDAWSALPVGTGSFLWDDTTGASDPDKPLDVYYYRPEVVTSEIPVWMIMHGAGRSGANYRDYFVSEAKAQQAIVIAPEFNDADWPGSRSYNLGNISLSESDLTPRDRQDWSFSKIEPLFDYLVDVMEPTLATEQYYMFGHSAGSQFTHRFLEWTPDARVKLAVAANAGWYTMPQFANGAYPHAWPYSLTNVPDIDPATASYDSFSQQQLNEFLGREMVVLLGDQDKQRSSSLRQTVQADAQGLNRLERGHYFFSQGQQQATTQAVDLNWELEIVPGVGHSGSQMAIAAARVFRLANLRPADFNQDGNVDGNDLTQWQSSYGINGGSDSEDDGDSDGSDYLNWQQQYLPAPPEPPTYYYVGSSGGNFFSESNWNTQPDGSGTSAPVNSLVSSSGDSEDDITLDLVIEGDFVQAPGSITIGEGGRGSLTLRNGARLDVNGSASDLDFDHDSTFSFSDSTLNVGDILKLGGKASLTGGTIHAIDDIESEAFAELSINGTTLSAGDNIEFFNFSAGSVINNVTLTPADRLALNSDTTNLVLTDSIVIVDAGRGDIEDIAGGVNDSAGTITLLGDSRLEADDLREGATLVLGGSSTASIGGLSDSDPSYVGDGGSRVVFLSTAATLSVPSFSISAVDPRDFIVNGITGNTYAENPSAWNISNWDGQSAVTLQLNSPAALQVPEPSAWWLVTILAMVLFPLFDLGLTRSNRRLNSWIL